jgi:predicted enzyme related to lactoylglutathione lyase
MVSAARLDRAFESMAQGAVPASRMVPDLEAALGLVRRLGGSVASEIRTAPGIGSWVFVADSDGSELLLWETAASIG